MNAIQTQFEKALLKMDRFSAEKLIARECETLDAVSFVENVIVPVLEKIGDDWDAGIIALSQVYMSGRICEELIDSILPAASPDRTNQPSMAIAVLEDYHCLGKQILYSSLRACGYELKDLVALK